MPHPADDLDGYAQLAVHLASALEHEREDILENHGHSEESFQDLENAWLARLSAAEDEAVDDDGVPPFVQRFSDAFARAQRAARSNEDEVMPLERYAMITRALSQGRELPKVLDKHGLSLKEYLVAHHHWVLRLATDSTLAARFTSLLR